MYIFHASDSADEKKEQGGSQIGKGGCIGSDILGFHWLF